MENIQPASGSEGKKFKTATGVELSVVTDTGVTPQETQETPFATEAEKNIIRNFSQGKEDWKEVDFKLRGAVRELGKLEGSLGDEANRARIQELRGEIDALKDEKFSNIRGGRGSKGDSEEIRQAITQATQEVPATTATPAAEMPAALNKEAAPLATTPETLPTSGPVTIEGEFTRVLEEKEKTPEELKQEKLEKIRAKLDRMTGVTKDIEERAEKIGKLDAVRKVGEMWNKVPKSAKYALAGAMLLSGGTAAMMGYTVASRLLGGAGAFVGFETMFENNYKKKNNEPRPENVKNRHALYAGVLAITIGALIPKIAGEVLDFLTPEHGAVVTGGTAAPAPTPKIEYVVEKGGTLWGGIESKLETQGLFANMEAGQKTYAIDALKDKFAAMSPDELKAIGITSGNINMINPGDHIDLTKVLGDTQLVPEVISHAEGLSPEQVAAIEHPVVPAPGVTTTTASTPEVSTIPQEITPPTASTEILAAADRSVHDDVNNLFGTKGFLGFGAQDGMESLNWKDPEVGFANQPVEKVLAANPSAFPAEGGRHFGIEDYGATKNMQTYLNDAVKASGVTAHPGETVSEYLKRAMVASLTRGTFEGQQ